MIEEERAPLLVGKTYKHKQNMAPDFDENFRDILYRHKEEIKVNKIWTITTKDKSILK